MAEEGMIEVEAAILENLVGLCEGIAENLRGLSKAHAALERRVTGVEIEVGEVKTWAPTPEG